MNRTCFKVNGSMAIYIFYFIYKSAVTIIYCFELFSAHLAVQFAKQHFPSVLCVDLLSFDPYYFLCWIHLPCFSSRYWWVKGWLGEGGMVVKGWKCGRKGTGSASNRDGNWETSPGSRNLSPTVVSRTWFHSVIWYMQ